MPIIRLALIAAAATLAVPAAAQPMPTQAVPYLATAGEADVYEITSSQVAVMRSQNPDVRALATMLIAHHSETTNSALSAAAAAGVAPPPPVLGPQHRGQIGELMSVPAAQFDATYLRQQLPAHQQALTLHRNYAASGDTAELRTAAAGAVPIVESHVARIEAMRSGM